MHEGFTSKNKDKTNLDIVICHEEKEFDAKQDNLNNKSILKILASKNKSKASNYDGFLNLPTSLNEINSIVEQTISKKIFSKNSSILIKDYLLNKNEKKLIKDKNFIILTEKEIQLLDLFLVQNKPISNLMDGGKCSIFKAKQSPGMIRKQWLSGFLDTSGTLSIDKGAKEALNQGGSLLPVGLTEVSGDFERGDVVILNDEIGNEIGKGVTTYSSVEASLIVGCRSEEILKKLGYQGKPEIIHRDDMVLF